VQCWHFFSRPILHPRLQQPWRTSGLHCSGRGEERGV
jgi:hypothetical protein